MDLNANNLVSGLRTIQSAAKTLTPLIGVVAGPTAENIGKILDAAAEVASTAISEAAAGVQDFSSEDEAALREISDDLQGEIEALGAEVAKTLRS